MKQIRLLDYFSNHDFIFYRTTLINVLPEVCKLFIFIILFFNHCAIFWFVCYVLLL